MNSSSNLKEFHSKVEWTKKRNLTNEIQTKFKARVHQNDQDLNGKKQRSSTLIRQSVDSCLKTIIDRDLIEYKSRYVASQMAHLVQHNPYVIQQSSTRHSQENNTTKDSNKIKRIMKIYSSLLLMEPIECKALPKYPNNGSNISANHNLDSTRKQVLQYIENLDGYCDEINMLRCILRSYSMIYVISAYKAIVARIDKVSQANKFHSKLIKVREWLA